jgi:hypothetical protein
MSDEACICTPQAWAVTCPVHTPGPNWEDWKLWEADR